MLACMPCVVLKGGRKKTSLYGSGRLKPGFQLCVASTAWDSTGGARAPCYCDRAESRPPCNTSGSKSFPWPSGQGRKRETQEAKKTGRSAQIRTDLLLNLCWMNNGENWINLMLVVDHLSKQIHLEPEESEHSLFRKKPFLIICFQTCCITYHLQIFNRTESTQHIPVQPFISHSLYQHPRLPLNTCVVLHSFSIGYIITCLDLVHLSVSQQISYHLFLGCIVWTGSREGAVD